MLNSLSPVCIGTCVWEGAVFVLHVKGFVHTQLFPSTTTMAGRYSPPPAPPRQEAFNPLSHLLKHLQDSPPTTPAIFTPIDLQNNPNTHDPEDILRELRTDGEHPFPIDRNVLKKVVQKKMRTGVDAISFLSSGMCHFPFCRFQFEPFLPGESPLTTPSMFAGTFHKACS